MCRHSFCCSSTGHSAKPKSSSSSSIGPPLRELGVYHLHNGIKNLLICDSSPTKTALYYAEVHMYTPNVPDVKLYRLPPSSSSAASPELGGLQDGTRMTGEQAKAEGEVVGAAWFRYVKRTHSIKLCVGDPEKVRDVVWAEMKDVRGHLHGKYLITAASEKGDKFENPFESGFHNDLTGDGAHAGEDEKFVLDEHEGGDEHHVLENKQTYKWLRTHSKADGLDNAYISRKCSCANFKLVDDHGSILTVFESNGVKSFRKQGKLKFYGGEDEKLGVCHDIEADSLELLTVLSYCVIQEKFRRGV